MNGGTNLGMSVNDGGEARLQRGLAAHPGEMPLWGQPGKFEIQLSDGTPVRITTDGVFGIGSSVYHLGFEASAVDFDKPFITETGYRAFMNVKLPDPGADAVRQDIKVWAISAIELDLSTDHKGKPFKKRKPLVPIGEEYREHASAPAVEAAA